MSDSRTKLPRFATQIGLTTLDIEAMSGEVSAEHRGIHFCNRDLSGQVVGVEHMFDVCLYRFTGIQALFAAPRIAAAERIVVTCGPIEALCAAAASPPRSPTIYAAVPGRLVPRAADALVGLVLQTGATRLTLSFPEDHAGRALFDAAWSLVHHHLPGMVEVDEFPPPSGRWLSALNRIRTTPRAA